MSGYGEIKYSNSQTYKGEFKNSKKNGYGTLIVSDQFKTEGKWKDDKLHGEGKITFLKDIDDEEKGTIIKGNYVKGNLHGASEKIYPDGDILYCVFNKHNKENAEAKFGRKATVKTIHQLGYAMETQLEYQV